MRLACVAAMLCQAALLTAASPPSRTAAPARAGRTVDSYFGHQAPDPYRWMQAATPALAGSHEQAAFNELAAGPELAAWTAAQTARTHAILGALPGRDALARDMGDIARGLVVVSAVTEVGHLIFFRRRDAGEPRAKLLVRDTQTGRERVLLDPNRIELQGAPVTIEQFAPSQDGRYVAVGIGHTGTPNAGTPSAGTPNAGPPHAGPPHAGTPHAGTPQASARQDVLYVLNADTGRRLPDQIDRTRLASVSWLPDGRSFFYNRLRRAEPGQGPQDRFTYQQVLLHHLGQDPSRDAAVFGAGMPGLSSVAPTDFVAVAAVTGTRTLLAIQNDGASPDLSLYLGHLPQGSGNVGYQWQRITRPEDGVVDVAAGRDTLYLRSRQGAPRYKVLALPLAHPVLARARLAVAPSGAVLTSMAVSAGALYVAGRSGAASTLVRVGTDGRAVAIALPRQGSIAPPREGPGSLTADPRVPGAIVGVASWVAPPAYYAVDDQGARVRDLALGPSSPTAGYVVTETTVPARDGRTRLPLSIIAARGTPHDGHRPVLVEGYGAYGISEEPSPALIPTIRAWVDAGGVMAIAHGRGGGELGEDWHAAGARDSKPNAIHDFVDSAWAMVDLGYASTDTLAVTATGAGGVTVGGAITEAPTLFRAAYLRNGLLDPLRHEAAPGAEARVPEFGTVALQADAAALLAIDPYQNVRAGVVYPAMLLSAGEGDPDVPFWHSAKMAARLAAVGRARGPVLLEAEEGDQAAEADGLAFVLWQLGGPAFRPSR